MNNNFRKQGGQSGGRNEGGERPSNYNRYQGEQSGGPRRETLHKATCSECNNTCEVPFRPNGSKPVYCKDCFGKKKNAFPGNANSNGNNGGERSYEKRDFAPRMEHSRDERPQHAPAHQPQPMARDHRVDELKSQMDSIQSKLDRIMKMLEGGVVQPQAAKHVEKPVMQQTAPKAAPQKVEKKIVPVAKKPAVKMAPKKAVTKAKPVAKKKK